MKNMNEYVGLSVAKNYMAERLEYEQSRRMLKRIHRKNPSKFYCAICHTLVSLGHIFVTFGRRLERFDLALGES